MPLTLPWPSRPAEGEAITSRVLRDNFQSVVDKFSGAIIGGDIAPNANIPGAAIADRSLAGAKLRLAAVSATEMASNAILTANLTDWTSGGAAGVTTPKLADAAVTGAKMGRFELDVAVSIHMTAWLGTGSVAHYEGYQDVVQTTYSPASYDLVGAYLKNLVPTAGNLLMCGASLNSAVAAPYYIGAEVYAITTNSNAYVNGTLVMVFMAK